MKRMVLLFLILLLAACAPAQVSSPTFIPATATVAAPTDTATPAPTSTPAPPSTPAADLLTQSGLADLPVYWQDANGQWFAGTTAQDARLVLTTEGSWLALPDGFSQFFADGGHYDPAQNAWVDANNKIAYNVDENGAITPHIDSIHFSLETWASLTPEEKADAYTKSPEVSPEGWARSNAIDTVPNMDHYQLYRDANGNAVAAYDFVTGKMVEFETAPGLWVITLPLKNGGTYDFPAIYPDRNAPDQEEEARRALQEGIDWLANYPGVRFNYDITTNDVPATLRPVDLPSVGFGGTPIYDADPNFNDYVRIMYGTQGEYIVMGAPSTNEDGKFDAVRVFVLVGEEYVEMVDDLSFNKTP